MDKSLIKTLLCAVAALVIGLGTPKLVQAHQFLPPGMAERIPNRLPDALKKLRSPSQIERGRLIFERETFGGNGRTCATCHPRSNNFTLDVPFISRLPKSDPLFIHERIPALARLENRAALRGKALILENLDGFDQPGTLRSVMHTLALGLTIKPQASFQNPQTGLPLHALGWSGDGSPGDGSLREFAVGAVVQHFTRSLGRLEGRDFRIPTALELDALEAFQLSLGRRETPIVDPNLPGAPNIPGFLEFSDASVTAGQTLFHGMPSRNGAGRRCAGCHNGGGALNDVDGVGENEQRATGLDRHPGAATCFFPTAPADGGFGIDPPVPPVEGKDPVVDKATFCTNGAKGLVNFLGSLFFNTQTVIEAADTAPFFHDNSAATLEDVVDFYRSGAFNNSITGAGNGFLIDDNQRNQIAAFLRALNVLENIRSAIASLDSTSGDPTLANERALADARDSVMDAIRVLKSGNIKIYQSTALPALVGTLPLLRSVDTADYAKDELKRARSLVLL